MRKPSYSYKSCFFGYGFGKVYNVATDVCYNVNARRVSSTSVRRILKAFK